MQSNQIFANYRYQGNNGLENIKYCSSCGAKFELKEDGGRIRPVCPNCGFVYYKNPSPGVSVLIIENERVLLCKRAPGNFQSGKWCLPCGFIEFDEDFLTAAYREVKEETGLDIVVQSVINVTFNYLAPELHSLVIVLLAKVLGGSPIAGDDIELLEWVPITGPLPEMAFIADSVIIEQYQEKRSLGIPVD